MRLAALLDRLASRPGSDRGAGSVRLERGEVGVNVTDITEDSRTALPGSLFVARPGERADGRAFIRAAIDAGARAILTDDPAAAERLPAGVALLVAEDVRTAAAEMAEAFFDFPSGKLSLVGVTGTNGKTTVATICHKLLNAAGVRAGLIGTVEIDDGREVAPAEMTTPPAIELSRTLATMVESGCRAAVMEVSSHALDQGRAAALEFDAAVFTNLSGDHLDYHKTMEEYAAAKRRLFERLAARVPPGGALAVVNHADPYSDFMAGPVVNTPGVPVCRVGERGAAPPPDLGVEIESADLEGLVLRIEGRVEEQDLSVRARVPLVGRHNAMNAAQAVAAATHVLRGIEGYGSRGAGIHSQGIHSQGIHGKGVSGEECGRWFAHGLTLVSTPRGRLDPVHSPRDDIRAFVDFAHTDHAIESMLAGVRPLVTPPGQVWLVFGAGGNKDRGKRPRMGAAAALGADRVVVTSDNPRSESPGSIITQVLSGVPEGRRDRVEVQADRRRAIAFAIERARPGDVVIIAGKGHEGFQEIKSGLGGGVERVAFDDFAEVRGALAERRARARASV